MKKNIVFLVAFIWSVVPLTLPTLVQAQTVSSNSCYTFNTNLGIGRFLSSSDANALQLVLVAQGLWNAGTPITTYTEAVASAVVGLQQKYAAEILTPNGLAYGTGYVGPSTRAELNSLYGCSTTTATTSATSQTFQCPSGWSCTAPAQTTPVTYQCPTGWTCTPANTSTASPANPTISTNSINLSLDAATPTTKTLPISNVTAGTYLNLPVLMFDVNAQDAAVHLHSLTVNLANDGQDVTNAYLYQGSTLVASTVISNSATNEAIFNIADNTPGANIPANTELPYIIAVDVTGLANLSNFTSIPVTASVSSYGLVVFNSSDATVPVSGSANGNTITVTSSGANGGGGGVSVSLPNVPSIVKQTGKITDSAGDYSAVYTATFNVQITTVGTSATFGLPNSSVPAIITNNPNMEGSFISIFENSTNINGNSVPLSTLNPTVTWTQPANTTLSSDGTSFTVAANQTVTVPVTASFTVQNPGSNIYAVALRGLDYVISGGQVQLAPMAAQGGYGTLMTSAI